MSQGQGQDDMVLPLRLRQTVMPPGAVLTTSLGAQTSRTHKEHRQRRQRRYPRNLGGADPSRELPCLGAGNLKRANPLTYRIAPISQQSERQQQIYKQKIPPSDLGRWAIPPPQPRGASQRPVRQRYRTVRGIHSIHVPVDPQIRTEYTTLTELWKDDRNEFPTYIGNMPPAPSDTHAQYYAPKRMERGPAEYIVRSRTARMKKDALQTLVAMSLEQLKRVDLATACMGVPNRITTATVCDIAVKLQRCMPRLGPVFNRVLECLFVAIYQGYKRGGNMASNIVSYFEIGLGLDEWSVKKTKWIENKVRANEEFEGNRHKHLDVIAKIPRRWKRQVLSLAFTRWRNNSKRIALQRRGYRRICCNSIRLNDETQWTPFAIHQAKMQCFRYIRMRTSYKKTKRLRKVLAQKSMEHADIEIIKDQRHEKLGKLKARYYSITNEIDEIKSKVSQTMFSTAHLHRQIAAVQGLPEQHLAPRALDCLARTAEFVGKLHLEEPKNIALFLNSNLSDMLKRKEKSHVIPPSTDKGVQQWHTRREHTLLMATSEIMHHADEEILMKWVTMHQQRHNVALTGTQQLKIKKASMNRLEEDTEEAREALIEMASTKESSILKIENFTDHFQDCVCLIDLVMATCPPKDGNWQRFYSLSHQTRAHRLMQHLTETQGLTPLINPLEITEKLKSDMLTTLLAEWFVKFPAIGEPREVQGVREINELREQVGNLNERLKLRPNFEEIKDMEVIGRQLHSLSSRIRYISQDAHQHELAFHVVYRRVCCLATDLLCQRVQGKPHVGRDLRHEREASQLSKFINKDGKIDSSVSSMISNKKLRKGGSKSSTQESGSRPSTKSSIGLLGGTMGAIAEGVRAGADQGGSVSATATTIPELELTDEEYEELKKKEREMSLVRFTIKHELANLRNIYTSYAQSDERDKTHCKMTKPEYILFLKDTQIVGPRCGITSKMGGQIFDLAYAAREQEMLHKDDDKMEEEREKLLNEQMVGLSDDNDSAPSTPQLNKKGKKKREIPTDTLGHRNRSKQAQAIHDKRREEQEDISRVIDERGWFLSLISLAQVWHPQPQDKHDIVRHIWKLEVSRRENYKLNLEKEKNEKDIMGSQMFQEKKLMEHMMEDFNEEEDLFQEARDQLLALVETEVKEFLESTGEVTKEGEITDVTKSGKSGRIPDKVELGRWGTFYLAKTPPPDVIDGFNLAAKLFGLIKFRVIKNAIRMAPELFTSLIVEDEVQKVLKKHEKTLAKLYKHFSKTETEGGNESAWEDTMDYNEFIRMLKHGRLYNTKGTTTSLIYSVFGIVQKDVAEEDEQQDLSTSLNFSEFKEAMLSLSAIRYPSPFKPLAQKFDMFAVGELQEWTRLLKKKKPH